LPNLAKVEWGQTPCPPPPPRILRALTPPKKSDQDQQNNKTCKLHSILNRSPPPPKPSLQKLQFFNTRQKWGKTKHPYSTFFNSRVCATPIGKKNQRRISIGLKNRVAICMSFCMGWRPLTYKRHTCKRHLSTSSLRQQLFKKNSMQPIWTISLVTKSFSTPPFYTPNKTSS
jgi:hypothetical protein